MKVVVIGGGTGLSRILRGIKHVEDIEISAIVTISDDGGSTGFLSRHFSIPAVGDIRRVLGAMSLERERLEASLEYRFKNTNTTLDGHTVGNILILAEILRTKSFLEGITSASHMLNIRGQIVPIAETHNEISAIFDDSSLVHGESSFCKMGKKIKKVYFENKNIIANPTAIKEILEADYVIIGIGSLFTSIIPNLIYPEVIQALKETTAHIIYFGNITIEKGETTDMTLMDHIHALEEHTFKGLIDTLVVSLTKIPPHIIKKYHEAEQGIIKNDTKGAEGMNILYKDLLSFEDDIIRHDPDLIEKAFKEIIAKDDIHPGN